MNVPRRRFSLRPGVGDGRTPEFRQDAPLFEAIRRDPVLSALKLIAEPWDIGQGGYQVGNFPPLFCRMERPFFAIPRAVSGCTKRVVG